MIRFIGRTLLNNNAASYLLKCNDTLPNSLARGFKSELKIKWVRPQKILCIKPEKSGDLKPQEPLDKTQFQLEFVNSKELETADDSVKKLFSLDYAPRWKSTQVSIKNTVDKVRRHPLDKGSPEARIARWTGAIRSMQELMDAYPRNKRMQVRLKELIDKRKKHLKYLRRWDYKRFEWILEKLDIVYKPPPNEFHWITRKESLRKLTQKHCDDIRDERLTNYRKVLEDEQPGFLEEKLRTLEFIREEEKACDADVTVTQEQIDDVRKQLNELLEERKAKSRLEKEQSELSIK